MSIILALSAMVRISAKTVPDVDINIIVGTEMDHIVSVRYVMEQEYALIVDNFASKIASYDFVI